MRFSCKHMLAGAALMAASGCTMADPYFGEALRYDMAIQTINPDPVYPEGGMEPGSSGEKAQKATERYLSGQTKQVQPLTTGGGGSSGGGSGPQ